MSLAGSGRLAVQRLFFGDFLLAQQKKVTRPPGRTPGTVHRTPKARSKSHQPSQRAHGFFPFNPGTGKHTILGVFSNIKGRSFPVVHPYMVWFMTLTDVPTGKHRIKISMGLDPTRMGELIHREFESQSPLHRINLINELRNLTFQQPGDYSILIEVDDEPILATSMTVTL